MIQIIRQFCQNTGCQPKDLVVEWTLERGACLIGTNSEGVKTSLAILARPDHIAQAVWLCANGQEHLYSQIQEQSSEIYGQVREWLSDHASASEDVWDEPQQSHLPETALTGEPTREDWRNFKTVAQIIHAFPMHPSADDLIDLYERNKKIKSSHLKALLEKRSR